MELPQRAPLEGELKSEIDAEASAPLLEEDRVVQRQDVVRFVDQFVPALDDQVADERRAFAGNTTAV